MIILFIFLLLIIMPELILLFIFINPFIGFWAILVCYDIGKIDHGAVWNKMDKIGMALATIGTILFLLPLLEFVFGLSNGFSLILLGFGFLLSLLAPVIMIIKEKEINIKSSTLFVLSICPSMLFVSAFLINKTWVVSLMVLATLLLLLWSAIMYYARTNKLS